MKGKSWLLSLAYRLDHHYVMQVSLADWFWALVAVPPVVALLGQLRWLVAVPLSVSGALALIGLWLARKKRYTAFVPALLDLNVGCCPRLQADEVVRIWASGRFGVEGRTRVLAHTQALYSFVRTREHIIAAVVQDSRFLLLARSVGKDTGYWYTFFMPDQVRSVVKGQLLYAGRAQPALAIRYRPSQASEAEETVYLSFDEQQIGACILADLQVDAPTGVFSPLVRTA